MKVLVPAETREGECRVAILPSTAAKFKQLGLEVQIQSGAGLGSYADDAQYAAAGVGVLPGELVADAMGHAEVIACVRPLDVNRCRRLRAGSIVISFVQPLGDIDTVRAVAEAGATLLSFDLLPRISRAQSMDALSSQALIAGYRAAVVAAERLPKFFPMFMTAAGTVQPAKVLVLGAGVAGLQAIATAKRLGAKVSAYDVRPASADEVRSMGGTFINLDLDAIEGAGGYAREMSEDRAVRQQELLAPYIADSDVVITTASIPGRPAPLLVTADMVRAMRPGSVVVDLASESGGNVEGSVAGQEVWFDDVLVWGGANVPSQVPVHASQLYAMNVHALLSLMVRDGEIVIDLTDEVIAGCAIVVNGDVRHEAARAALQGGE